MNTKNLKVLALAAALAAPVAYAQDTSTSTTEPATTTTTTTTTGVVEDKNNPSNRDAGTDWGWLGLAGLLGLGGLMGRRYVETTTVRDTTVRR